MICKSLVFLFAIATTVLMTTSAQVELQEKMSTALEKISDIHSILIKYKKSKVGTIDIVLRSNRQVIMYVMTVL
jgi:hypothetical protein